MGETSGFQLKGKCLALQEEMIYAQAHCALGGNGADGSRATWTKPRSGELSGEGESIEVYAIELPNEFSCARRHTRSFPAGIESTFKV
jgi:hypothetical protein